MNTYFVHMLERAREVHKINEGDTHRGSIVKCPFCIADEDESWFRFRFEYKLHPGIDSKKPERIPPPHCQHCPLLSLFGIKYEKIMNDCVEMGFEILKTWEELHEDI